MVAAQWGGDHAGGVKNPRVTFFVSSGRCVQRCVRWATTFTRCFYTLNQLIYNNKIYFFNNWPATCIGSWACGKSCGSDKKHGPDK